MQGVRILFSSAFPRHHLRLCPGGSSCLVSVFLPASFHFMFHVSFRFSQSPSVCSSPSFQALSFWLASFFLCSVLVAFSLPFHVSWLSFHCTLLLFVQGAIFACLSLHLSLLLLAHPPLLWVCCVFLFALAVVFFLHSFFHPCHSLCSSALFFSLVQGVWLEVDFIDFPCILNANTLEPGGVLCLSLCTRSFLNIVVFSASSNSSRWILPGQ